MQKYSEKFKTEMLQKLTGVGAISARRLSMECGIAESTLSGWRSQAKLGAMAKAPNRVGTRRWTPAEKLRVVMAAAAAGEEGRGALLRREGLHDADIERFQAELSEGPQPTATKRDAADKKRIKELEREVRRKDRALAEAAALVVLSKKLNAYFDPDGVGETEKDYDT